MPHDVFISHSSSDKSTADAICSALEAKGIRCWIAPRDVQPGSSWAGAIVDAISACRLMVVVVSGATEHSSHVTREVELAADRELVIVPFKIHNSRLNGSLEYFLQPRHWLDAMTPPLEAHVNRLCEVVPGLLASLSPRKNRQEAQLARVTTHLGFFRRTGSQCCFINVTNLCRDVDIEVTHVWIEVSPQVYARNVDRPLPKRLRPHESWETWVPGQVLFDLPEEQLYQSARVRFSTGEVIASVRNTTVPGQGTIPGGAIESPP